MVVFLWSRLVENLSLEANLEAEELGSIREGSCDVLQGSFCVSDKSSIVCKEEVPDQPLLGLGMGLKAP